MKTLGKLIAGTPYDEELDKVREMCDLIEKEEHPHMNIKYAPQGPNVILTLEVPGRYDSELCYLTLERESIGHYVARLWSIPKAAIKSDPRETQKFPKKSWDIKEAKAKNILTEYAKLVKYFRGE
jgi:hypothetical protein